jgi:hypothetical protein
MGQRAGRCSSSTIPKRWWLARSRQELPSHRRLAMSTAGALGESSIHSATNGRSANLSARGRRPKPCFARKRGRSARLLCLGEREPVSPLMSCPHWTTSRSAGRDCCSATRATVSGSLLNRGLVSATTNRSSRAARGRAGPAHCWLLDQARRDLHAWFPQRGRGSVKVRPARYPCTGTRSHGRRWAKGLLAVVRSGWPLGPDGRTLAE